MEREKINTSNIEKQENGSEEIKEFEELSESEKIEGEIEKTKQEWHHATIDEEDEIIKKMGHLRGKLVKAKERETKKQL